MSDGSAFTAPCIELQDSVRCIGETHYIDGEPQSHVHQFPTRIDREQVRMGRWSSV